MTSPCPRCGHTKTDPVGHGLMYKLVWAFGYRLHECAQCGAPRFLPRHDGESPDSSRLGKEPVRAPPFAEERGALRTAEESPEPKVTTQVTAADSSDRGLRRCPVCGSTEYHRTKRTTLERILSRSKVAHCEKCGLRFPYPGHPHRSSGSVELGEAVATVPRSAEEKRASKMAEEITQPKVTKQVTGADSSNRGLRRCPTCGSAEYHRTKRTTLEHLLLRPRMARCEKCGLRFPYAGHREKYPDPLKVVEPAATVLRPAEERRAPEMAEESSQPKVTQPVIVVDYSNHGLRRCPDCGSSKYHRSERTTLDRVLLRPALAHCEKCGARFPYPRHHGKSPDPVKSGAAAATVSHVGEEGRASRTAEESSQPKVAKQGTAADSSNRGLRRCPVCGSTSYRRSRRTSLERILLRPKMARCRNCRKRFPYPQR
jgi:transcription elongation factor Elf1